MLIHRSRTASRWVALLAAASLVATACGDDDDGGAGDDAPAATQDTGTDGIDATDGDDADDGPSAGTRDIVPVGGPAIDPAAVADADREGSLKVAWILNLDTLDPLRNANAQNVAYNLLSYDSLIYRDPLGELHPGLAESWEWAEDGSTFTMTIRDGVTFHDGTSLDADVVKANLDRLLGMPDSPVFSAVRNVERVDVIDPSTVVLVMTQPDATLEYSLADRAGAIVSGKAIADGVDLGSQAVGAGPYRVVEFRPSDGIVYERFEDYWGDPNAAVAKRVELVGIADGNARASGLITGDFDAAQITPSQVAQVQNAGIDIVANTSLWFIQVYHNRSRDFFADPDVTRAMSMAIDRDAICAAIYYGFCQPTITMFPDDYWAGSPDIPDDYFAHDVEEAKRLLAEAGYADGFSFELMFAAGSDPYPQLAELLQAQWGEIGLDVRIRPVDISQLATTFFVDKQSDALIGGSGGPEPTSLFQTLFTSTGFANPGGVVPEGLDELVDRMSRAIDRDERAEIVREASRMVVENGLNTFLVFPEYSWGISDDIVNWQPNGVINSPILRGVGVK